MIGFEIRRMQKVLDSYLIETDQFVLVLRDDQLDKYKITKSAIVTKRHDKLIIIDTYLLLIPTNNEWKLKIIRGKPFAKIFMQVIDPITSEQIEIGPKTCYKIKNDYLIFKPFI